MMGYGNYNTCTCFKKCIWWRLSSTFRAVSLWSKRTDAALFSKLFERIQCKINISLLLMQHIYISFALNPWYIYVVPFPSRSFVSPYTVLYKCVDMFPMIRVLLSGVKVTFEAILAVFHGHLVWHLGGILNGNCVMDIRHMFVIRYIGPLNSKHTSSASFSVTLLPSSLTFI